MLKRRRFDSHILFVGDNEPSALMMGINVRLVKSIVFMQIGLFAGILSTLEVTYFWPSLGQGYLLTTLATGLIIMVSVSIYAILLRGRGAPNIFL